ncbi:hypothetical protein [Thalassotalea profundi]|uniref:ATP-binding protein n=1 Tax=Thalassotalea profundi TaxID=2036687 RepID=A0ABQ3IP16_9GAMM|nr:hypothetical protein [Thalassotalea profundi]GHE87431.1 hypothetical protein GCM10011501_16120 [Thalassotalea profundi]
MAININESLSAEHVCIAADTGGGKTAAVKLLGVCGDCVAIFDLYGNYRFDGRKGKVNKFNGLGGREVFTFHDRKSFSKAFISAWRSGKKFVLAYNPVSQKPLNQKEMLEFRRQELDFFGGLMWAALDGKRKLYIAIEELAKLVSTTGKDSSIIGEIATGGRAFGGVLVTVFQRKQEVPKTIWNMSPNKIIGALDTKADIKAMNEATDAPIECLNHVSKLNAKYKAQFLHYIIKSAGFGNVSAKRVSLKAPFKVDNLALDEFLLLK